MDDELSPILEALYRGDADAAAGARADRGELDVLEAAALGDVDELARILAADPAAVAVWSPDGFTPLHYAAFFGRPDAACVLIDAGADLEAPSRNMQFAQDARPLHSAAAAREHEVARLLLEAGADPNAEQHGGFTPLRQAGENGDAELAALLRRYGATR